MEIGQPFTFLNLLSAVIVVLEIRSEEAKLCDPLQSWKRKTSLCWEGPCRRGPPTLGLRRRRLCELHLEATYPCRLQFDRTSTHWILVEIQCDLFRFLHSMQTKDSDMLLKSGRHPRQVNRCWHRPTYHMIAKLFLAASLVFSQVTVRENAGP